MLKDLVHRVALIPLVAGALILSHPASAGVLFADGFESPVVTPGAFQNFNTGTTFGPWTVVGPQVSIVSTTFTQNGFSFVAQQGNQWLDLTGDGANSTADGVKTTLATTIGQAYNLSFYVGNIVDPGGVFGTSSTVDVLVNGLHGSCGYKFFWHRFREPRLATILVGWSSDNELNYIYIFEWRSLRRQQQRARQYCYRYRCRPRALHLGHDDPGLCRVGLHGLSAETERRADSHHLICRPSSL